MRIAYISPPPPPLPSPLCVQMYMYICIYVYACCAASLQASFYFAGFHEMIHNTAFVRYLLPFVAACSFEKLNVSVSRAGL